MAVQSEFHWWQNTYQNRFQEWAPNYLEGVVTTDLIPLSNIKQVPIAMFAGTADSTCTYQKAVEAKNLIGDAVVHFETKEGGGHSYFGVAND